MNASAYLILILMFAVVGALVAGVVLMMRGGEANRKYGNRLMVARVSLQGLVILLLGLLFLMPRGG